MWIAAVAAGRMTPPRATRSPACRRRLLEYVVRVLARRACVRQQVDDDPVLVVLMEAYMGEELTRFVLAEPGVEHVPGFRA